MMILNGDVIDDDDDDDDDNDDETVTFRMKL